MLIVNCLFILTLLVINSYAGMDFSMLGGVPHFNDRFEAILFGLVNNEDKEIEKDLMYKIESLNRQKLGLNFRSLKHETAEEFYEKREAILDIDDQIYYVQQCLVVATDHDYAMMTKEQRILKYEQLHGIKLQPVGSEFYAMSEPVKEMK